MKKLGFGLMRLPLLDSTDETSINFDEFTEMADTFIDRGFTYFDTAYMYHEFKSEAAAKKIIVDRHDRDSFTIASKMPSMMLEKDGDVERIFEEQLNNVGVEYFDYYLIHNLNVDNYEKAKKFGAFEYLAKQRENGRIHELGFSFHDNAKVLDEILTEHPEMQFVQLQLNYLDWDNVGIQSRKCYETARKHGKEVVVMEPVKGGTLANVPKKAEELFREMHPDWSPASWAIRFAASLDGVRVVLSGMSSFSQLDENTSYMDSFTPLTKEETDLIFKVRDIIYESKAVPCTGCRYCVEANNCPMNILIPNYFALYNAELKDTNEFWKPQGNYYQDLVSQGNGKASECIGCRGCESVCPQHIPISEWMPKVAEAFEN